MSTSNNQSSSYDFYGLEQDDDIEKVQKVVFIAMNSQNMNIEKKKYLFLVRGIFLGNGKRGEIQIKLSVTIYRQQPSLQSYKKSSLNNFPSFPPTAYSLHTKRLKLKLHLMLIDSSQLRLTQSQPIHIQDFIGENKKKNNFINLLEVQDIVPVNQQQNIESEGSNKYNSENKDGPTNPQQFRRIFTTSSNSIRDTLPFEIQGRKDPFVPAILQFEISDTPFTESDKKLTSSSSQDQQPLKYSERRERELQDQAKEYIVLGSDRQQFFTQPQNLIEKYDNLTKIQQNLSSIDEEENKSKSNLDLKQSDFSLQTSLSSIGEVNEEAQQMVTGDGPIVLLQDEVQPDQQDLEFGTQKEIRYFDDNTDIKAIVCRRCKKRGHMERMCSMESISQCYNCLGPHMVFQCDIQVCFKCNTLGHILRDCKNLSKMCFRCNKNGHIERYCGMLEKRQKNNYGNRSQVPSEETEDPFADDIRKAVCLKCRKDHQSFNCFSFQKINRSQTYIDNIYLPEGIVIPVEEILGDTKRDETKTKKEEIHSADIKISQKHKKQHRHRDSSQSSSSFSEEEKPKIRSRGSDNSQHEKKQLASDDSEQTLPQNFKKRKEEPANSHNDGEYTIDVIGKQGNKNHGQVITLNRHASDNTSSSNSNSNQNIGVSSIFNKIQTPLSSLKDLNFQYSSAPKKFIKLNNDSNKQNDDQKPYSNILNELFTQYMQK